MLYEFSLTLKSNKKKVMYNHSLGLYASLPFCLNLVFVICRYLIMSIPRGEKYKLPFPY